MIPHILGFAAAALLFSPSTARAQSLVLANEEIPIDDLRDRHVTFETAPIQPIAASSTASLLCVVNQPGSRLALLHPDTLARVFEVQIGLGAVSVVRRPGTDEMWVVDSIDSCVHVVDLGLKTITRTIRVGAEPHGLAFTPSGDRAYVTCSGADRVDVVRSSIYRVVKSIPIPARCPRGIVYHAGRAWVVPFLSGNNTAPVGTAADPNAVVAVKAVTGPGVTPLPDRDLFAIPTQPLPELDDLDPAATLSGLGTTLFNIHVRPGTDELWIPNTEALNAVHEGEVNFVAGQVVSNRITIVDATGTVPPRVVDLDALAPPDRKCGQPDFVAFDATGRAFVCAYGNDLVGVLRLGPGRGVSWEGAIELPPKQAYPRGTGPRGAWIDLARRMLYVFNKVDNSITKVPLGGLPGSAGWQVTAPNAMTIGFDPTSDEERLGRHLFTNARFSASQTSSCASCHVDGHTDGLAWDLSRFLDPEGTPDDQLAFGLDVKGPLVTQSVRRLAESGPFHWRGEKRHVDDFQGAFVALLENTVNGVVEEIGPDFQYLRHYIDRLAYPPNPRQSRDRRYTAAELRGATLFFQRPVMGSLACADCHVLPIGTSGEIVAMSTGGVPRSLDVPQLRGVADRFPAPFQVGGLFGTRTELGVGLTHGGAYSSLQESLRALPLAPASHHFNLTPAEAELLASFLTALDTGVAPSAATLVTANATNWAVVAAKDLPFLRQQAELGHCELVVWRTPQHLLGQLRNLACLYDPATRKYRTAWAAASQLDESVLLQEAAAGLPVSFLGVPGGMGLPTALDRDLDGLLDLDEIAPGTDPEDWDSDDDDLPDGYEIEWGLDPHQVTSGSNDVAPPSLVGPARLVYATTNTIKFEFDTSELSRINISYNGGYPVQRSPMGPHSDTRHWIVLNNLQPDTAYQIRLDLKDSSGNVATDTSTVFRTRPRATPEPARITSISATLGNGPGGSTVLKADVTLKVGTAAAASGYQVQASVYHKRWDGTIAMVAASVLSPTVSSGVAAFNVPLPPSNGPSPGSVVLVVKDVLAPTGSPPWVMGLSTATSVELDY